MYAMNGILIQDNLYLICKILEGIKDGTKAALINLDQSKALDRVDQFLASVLETAGFKLEFRRWISMMYHHPQTVVQVNEKQQRRLFLSSQSGRVAPCHFYVLTLDPLLRRLTDEGANPALCGIPFAGPLTARVSAFDDITIFVSCCLDIKAVKKVVTEYKWIAGAKVNFDKSEGLQLSAWMSSDTLPGPFCWSDGPIRILLAWFGPNLQPEWN